MGSIPQLWHKMVGKKISSAISEANADMSAPFGDSKKVTLVWKLRILIGGKWSRDLKAVMRFFYSDTLHLRLFAARWHG